MGWLVISNNPNRELHELFSQLFMKGGQVSGCGFTEFGTRTFRGSHCGGGGVAAQGPQKQNKQVTGTVMPYDISHGVSFFSYVGFGLEGFC